MVGYFDRTTMRKRRTSSKLITTILLCIWHSPISFVHSFQTPTFASRRNGRDTVTYKQTSLQVRRPRLDDFSGFRFATNIDEAETISTEEVDSNDSNAQMDIEYSDEPDYCCVDFDDISSPFISREDSESTFIEYSEDGLVLPAGPVGQLKENIANFLTQPSVEIVIALVVLLNSLLVALSTLDSIYYLFPYIYNAEIIVGTIFLADFLGRWFSSSRDRFGFILDPQFAIDVIVVIFPLAVSITPYSLWQQLSWLPPALFQPSGLYNLQLLRVLRLERVLQDLDTFERFAEQVLRKTNVKTNIVQEWQLQLARVALSLFTLISVATGLIYTAEHMVNPNINNYFDALYFGLTTLTTVGFGDVSPVTSQGKLIVCGSIVFGVAVVPGQAAALVEALLDREKMKNSSDGNGMRTFRQNGSKSGSIAGDSDDSVLALDTAMSCSNCGASFHWASASYCYKCGEKL